MRKVSLSVTILALAHALSASADPESPPVVPVVEIPVVVAPAPRVRREAWPQPALGASASGQPEVLFTFDDGPGGASTESVLDILRAHHVKAVFFLIGRNVRAAKGRGAALIERMVSEGHVVGNHTESHRDLCLRANAPSLDAEIDDSARQLAAAAGMNAILFRSPYGARCHALEKALGARGMTHLHWDVDPQEWRNHDAARTQAVIIGALSRLRDDQRAVVLTHDIHATTVTALPVILEWIRAENQRRAAAGRKPIRILSPSDVAVEKLAPEVRAILAAVDLGAGLPQLEHRLVAPLTSPRAQAGVPSL